MSVEQTMMDIHSIDMKELLNSKETKKVELEKYAKLLELPQSNLRLHKDELYYIEWGRFSVYTRTYMLEEEPLIGKYFKEKIEHNNIMYIDGKYEDVYMSLDPKEILVSINDIMKNKDLPNSLKFDIWLQSYTQLEYNHDYMMNALDTSLITETNKEKLVKDEKGYVKVYRGMTDKSTPNSKSISWTTDIKTASFFANRYRANKRKLVEGLVHIDDIHYYNLDREQEVLVEGSKIKVTKEIHVDGTQGLLESLKRTNCDTSKLTYTDLYEKGLMLLIENLKTGKNELIIDYLTGREESEHGVIHTKRVLLHVLTLSMLYKLKMEDVELLIVSAVYHDIARSNDDACVHHGKDAVEYMNANNIRKALNVEMTEDYEKVFDFIVTYHCKPDDEGYSYLADSDIKDKNKALKLFKIFKDADGLDRVRLGDLDSKYLRMDKSLLLTHYAHDVLKSLQ